MRSRKVDFRMPWRWYEWIEQRALTMKPRPYNDIGAYFKGVSFHDAMVQRPHTLTIDFANAGLNEQDRVIEELLKVQPAHPISGSWLEHRLEEAVVSVAERHNVKLTIEEVREMLAQKIRDRLL
jgi:hypothetical protein